MHGEFLQEIMKHRSFQMRRSDVARNLGVPISTLKFYTQEGLLKVAGTTEGGMTLYDIKEVASRLADIEKFKKAGKSLAEIRNFFVL